MSEIIDIWNKLRQEPNGEKVGRRMAQVLDFSLDPENEGYSSAAMQFLHVITEWEGRLLGREGYSGQETLQAKRILVDSSGLVRNTEFEAWVLGETDSPISPERPSVKAIMLRNES